MAKQRFKSKIAYLYKKKQKIKDITISYADTDTHETEAIPFYCDAIEKTRRIEVPLSNTYRTVTETVIRTDEDLNFEKHDRITFEEYPSNDVNSEDFSMIVSAITKPRFVNGSKYRNKDINTWELRLS
jgi:hypothetical protein